MADLTSIFGNAPFNASSVDPTGPSGQLPISGPEGLPVVISSSEMKAAKTDGNYFLELTLTVIEGAESGAEGTMRLNLINSNENAVRIAQRELSALGRVTGVWEIATSEQLHGIPFRVVTVAKSYTGNDGKEYQGSEVKKILDIDGNPPKTDGSSAPAPATSAKPKFAEPTPPGQTQWKKNPEPAAKPAGEKPAWMKPKA